MFNSTKPTCFWWRRVSPGGGTEYTRGSIYSQAQRAASIRGWGRAVRPCRGRSESSRPRRGRRWPAGIFRTRSLNNNINKT